MRLLWPKILVSLLQCGVTLFINPQLKAKGADKQPVQLTSFTTDLGHFPSTNPTVRSPPWSAVASTLLYYLLVQTQCVVPHEYHYSRAVAEPEWRRNKILYLLFAIPLRKQRKRMAAMWLGAKYTERGNERALGPQRSEEDGKDKGQGSAIKLLHVFKGEMTWHLGFTFTFSNTIKIRGWMKRDRRIVAHWRTGPRCTEMYFFSEIFPNRRVAVCFLCMLLAMPIFNVLYIILFNLFFNF